VPVSVPDKEMAFDGALLELIQQGEPQQADAGSRVQNQQFVVTSDLRAGSVAAVFYSALARGCNGAARPPEPHRKGQAMLAQHLADRVPKILQSVRLRQI